MGLVVSRAILPGGSVLLDEIGNGLVTSCAAGFRTTLYPVGPQRGPDQHPTFVGRCETEIAGPIFLTASMPWGLNGPRYPVSSRAAALP
jgi:hypothetical protein